MALTCGAALSRYAAAADTAGQEHVEVETTYGRIRGLRTNGLQTFKGIPYGGPVSGAHRFKAAPRLQPWTGVRDALKGGAPSLQSPLRPYYGISEGLPAEDCLFLNVWTPATPNAKSWTIHSVWSASSGSAWNPDKTGPINPRSESAAVSPLGRPLVTTIRMMHWRNKMRYRIFAAAAVCLAGTLVSAQDPVVPAANVEALFKRQQCEDERDQAGGLPHCA